ncbi:ead/Ea22-like family protein [Salmonella enterica subsp. enterica]|uniref:Ead/Ea22-like family protein n=1 Tax=Salmonella enterica subsp. enterica serovar Bovismorbificans TaxID=58097 RepID=A0A702B9V0_SALET|nr:ead/Ea22-like family protein [Salmonella enterica subsp. enterica serovar Bovismorbificans]EBR3312490.1 ead/Ea22-like family protein [Salmonella enterica]EBY0984832.1 ead/Ea22-like family protein [Salmonella enterica subsp. enterica serovar Bovismorbificans]EBY1040447.1 ead/Ea22-like family protein [Salmonella enterica subsp. enterica serovar Bovismorbificans]ECF7004441.1 ead/Ea22-like family protein [Salmonella enterica subsp. enterica serovar Bovismorbificans]
MNIDKRALREVAEKATKGPWTLFSDIDTKTFSIHTPRDKRCENVIKWGGFDCQPNAEANAEFIAAFNPKVALALLDELEHYKSREERVTKLVLDNSTSWDALYKKLEAAEKRIAEQREYYEGVIADGSKRIAELERSETQLINERDAAESALADMYQAATGERPEWSNMFGFADAVDVVEERLATLEANQSQTTPTGIQLITEAIGAHGYIVGCLLQGRPDLALEESRKWVSAFGQAAEIVSAQDADDIKVKGD